MEMATLDVENLYGNIAHDVGLEAVNFWLEKIQRDTTRITNDFILEGVQLILENNVFYFNGQHYRQIRGTAMGTKMAPIYATLTLGYLETKLYDSIFNDYGRNVYNNFINSYFRYLDDILILFDRRSLSIETIDILLNNLCPELNFKLEMVGDEVNILYIKVLKLNNVLETDIYAKSTDTKQYLNFYSNHPRPVKRALPYNLSRRICTIVFNTSTKLTRLKELKCHLLKRNYPSGLIDDGIKKAVTYDRKTLLLPKVKNPV